MTTCTLRTYIRTIREFLNHCKKAPSRIKTATAYKWITIKCKDLKDSTKHTYAFALKWYFVSILKRKKFKYHLKRIKN